MAKGNKLVFLYPLEIHGIKPGKKYRMYCKCNTKGHAGIDYEAGKYVYAQCSRDDACPICGASYFTFVEKGGAKANECNLRTKQG